MPVDPTAASTRPEKNLPSFWKNPASASTVARTRTELRTASWYTIQPVLKAMGSGNHKKEDFARWKVGFDSTNAMKKPHGWKRSNIYTQDGDRNNVMVVEEFATMEGAKAFAGSPELRAAMGKAGVVGAPDIRFVNHAFQASA